MSEKFADAKSSLEWAITFLLTDSKHGFYGHILQSMPVTFTNRVPTAGIAFDSRLKQFNLYINDAFWLSLSKVETVAVLLHEIMHITHKHVYYDLLNHPEKDRLNIAMDLVINQRIRGLPKQCMFVENFKDKTGKPFPKDSITEIYYDLLEQDAEMFRAQSDGKDGGPEGEENQDGNGGKGKPGTHNGEKGAWHRLGDMTKKPQFDAHDWDLDSQDNSQLKEKLEGIRDLLKRAQTKVSHGHDLSPEIQDLLEQIKRKIQALDAKAILLSTLKKSMPSKYVKKSWWRDSNRYGDDAPGNLRAPMPKIYVMVDTSGSISIDEANEFLAVTNQFLTVGVDKCTIGLFHTECYHEESVKKNFKLRPEVFKSGGTELTDAFKKAIKKAPDLIIVLTDGHWGMPEINTRKMPEVCFVISKGGSTAHPMKNIGRTVQYSP